MAHVRYSNFVLHSIKKSMKLRFVYLGGGSNPLLIEVPKSHLMFLNNISTSQFWAVQCSVWWCRRPETFNKAADKVKYSIEELPFCISMSLKISSNKHVPKPRIIQKPIPCIMRINFSPMIQLLKVLSRVLLSDKLLKSKMHKMNYEWVVA